VLAIVLKRVERMSYFGAEAERLIRDDIVEHDYDPVSKSRRTSFPRHVTLAQPLQSPRPVCGPDVTRFFQGQKHGLQRQRVRCGLPATCRGSDARYRNKKL